MMNTNKEEVGLGSVLAGVRVLEVAMWGFVPSAGAVLADWGADVIKIEHPVHGDPMRGLVTSGYGDAPVNFMWEIMNRGKRSVAVDLRTDAGRSVALRLAEQCDVFLTSFLPEARRSLQIDVEDITAVNPKVIYALGSGMGPAGPELDRGGYDMAAYWARSGIAHNVTPDGSEYPLPMPAAAFGDLTSGALLAGGIAAALFGREKSGEGCVVDLSLLASGMWAMSVEITGVRVLGIDSYFRPQRSNLSNPIFTSYRTKDRRYLQLVMLEADRHWPDLCRRIGRPDLIEEERFRTAHDRQVNSEACVAELQAVFDQHTLSDWLERLNDATGVWAVVAKPSEVPDDLQAIANGYISEAADLAGAKYPLVPSPLRFNGSLADTGPAPEHGQHTEAVLLELGWTWDEIASLREQGAF